MALKKWSQSLKKISYNAFYDISKDAVLFSQSDKLLKFFRTFFQKKYIYTDLNLSYFFLNFYLVLLDIRYMIVDILVFMRTLQDSEVVLIG